MGIILSRYRNKKSAEEQLEDIENEMEDIENNRQHAAQVKRYIVYRLIAITLGLYTILAILYNFYFSHSFQLFYLIAFICTPIIFLVLNKCINWIYERKISKDRTKLSSLRKKKEKILDDVMNKETYKVAKPILDKYAPERIQKSPLMSAPNLSRKVIGTPDNEIGVGSVALISPGSKTMEPHSMAFSPKLRALSSSLPRQRELIRPIVSRRRSVIGRVLDVFLDDGPDNRYALICKNCASHNGMALKDEFEYLAFRCVYCHFPNPSRKVHPDKRSQIAIGYHTEDNSSPNKKNTSSDDDSQYSGVEITEVENTDSSPSKSEVTSSKIEEDKPNPLIITEELSVTECQNEGENKKTQ